MFDKIRLASERSSEVPTLFDRILEKTILRFLPESVTPNQITVFRYFSVPVVIYFLLTGQNILSVISFLISAFSDAADGALARTKNKITEWGKIHDSLADKLLIGSVGAIVISMYLSFYLIAIIILIEVLLVFGVIVKSKRGLRVFSSLWPGKTKMIFQCSGIAFILLYTIFPVNWFLPAAAFFIYLAILFGIISLAFYNSI